MMGPSLEIADLLGWMAVLFTLTAFSMRTMLPLRIAAIGSNICFIGFGYLEGTLPILALHVLLLPFNLMRLRQILVTIHDAEWRDAFEIQKKIRSSYSLRSFSKSNTSDEKCLMLGCQSPERNPSNNSDLELLGHRPLEISGLLEEISALREQLRRSALDQTVVHESIGHERTIIDIGTRQQVVRRM